MFLASARLRVRNLPVISPLARSLSVPRISTVHRDVSSEPSIARRNHLITQLTRSGRLADARRLFDETRNRDLITWTALISGYARSGLVHEARLLFDRPDALKDVVTWTALLAGYLRSGRLREAEDLFDLMPERNVITWNTMISGYANNGLIDEALKLFDEMRARNVVSWNTVLTALAQSGRVDEAYALFQRMKERDVVSWTAMIAGLSQSGRVDEARILFEQMPERNVVSWNAMISGYAQNGRVDEAFALFERMPERSIPSWNTMITGFVQNGELRRARELFGMMGDRDVVTWTSLITGYLQDGMNETALKLFSEMMIDGIKPNEGTFVSVLAAAGNLAALREGWQLHQLASKTKFQFSPFVESALINMYSKCGEIWLARKVFDFANHKDLVSWNGMIAAYAHHGYGGEAIQLYEGMRRNGLQPDDVTYVGLLSACSRSGLVDEGAELFDALVGDESIKVRDDHFACLVDLCSRAGRLEDAVNFIGSVETKASSACVWGALLSGCNSHRNMRIGKLAAKKMLEVEPNNAGAYMLLSNIYSSVGRWEEAAKVKLEMKERGLKKQPGCSWIEVGSRVHVFVARDKAHGEAKSIYSLLRHLHGEMKVQVLSLPGITSQC